MARVNFIKMSSYRRVFVIQSIYDVRIETVN